MMTRRQKLSQLTVVVLLAFLMIVACSRRSSSEADSVVVTTQLWPTEATRISWLAENSASVVEGVVIAPPRPFRTSNLEGRPTVSTEVKVRVTKVLKGQRRLGSIAFIGVPGGTLDGITVMSQGVPRFRKGEKVLVALDSDDDPAKVVGGFHGKFTLCGANASRDASFPKSEREYLLSRLERELSGD